MDDDDIFELCRISDNANAKLILNKYINIDENPDMETVAFIGQNDSERIAIFKKIDG